MTHPMDIVVGQRLRKFRERVSMSQKTLANNLGVSFQQVQKYESAANRISAGKLYDAAAILGAEVGDFFAGAKPATERSTRKRAATVVRAAHR